jgi:hypothetical protein
MKVLIITRSQDNASVQMVTHQLTQSGATVVRFDTDLYPQDMQLRSCYASGNQGVAVRTPNGLLELHDVDAVWYRRFSAGNRLPQSLGDTLNTCRDESRLALYGTIVSLDCFHLDPIQRVRGTDYKELQLREAMRCGMEIPATVITNDPQAVLEFSSQVKGNIVAKMQGHFAIYREGQENVVFTNKLKPDDLKNLDGLKYAPMIFQEAVPKKLELRVTVVGKQVFAAAIDSQKSERAQTDWRRDGVDLIEDWVPHQLPEDLEKKLLELVSFFGLNYAAADFILTPDDRYVFLEVNAAGEWFWLEQVCKLGIAKAISDVLTTPSARR